jgi:hypothetical protein
MKISIGVAADMDGAPDLPPPPKSLTHSLASVEELERPSPQPFRGKPDIDYPQLDSLEGLYVPRFLLRELGEERFVRIPYYLLWRSEAGRAKTLGVDAKAGLTKKRRA